MGPLIMEKVRAGLDVHHHYEIRVSDRSDLSCATNKTEAAAVQQLLTWDFVNLIRYYRPSSQKGCWFIFLVIPCECKVSSPTATTNRYNAVCANSKQDMPGLADKLRPFWDQCMLWQEGLQHPFPTPVEVRVGTLYVLPSQYTSIPKRL